jgi:diaminohydroxyphosphoribosylaminopyrimidine deaminase / 5-amino-6-(5-phosphoribosylamino)uracil reductase
MDYTQRALALARTALGRVSPNPAVGAVIVKDGRIIGEGYTQPPGGAHAEIVALKQAGAAAQGATVYVTLEPCCYHGRTPPCSRALIEAGVAAVHVAYVDPNPLVSGKGLEELHHAGVEVVLGEHEAEANEVVEGFAKWIGTRRPFVTAKYAMTIDGRIATWSGDSRWVSGEESRLYVHRLRDDVDAIMVGVGTVITDDPLLTARLSPEDNPRPPMGRQPLRLIIDSQGQIPLTAKVLQADLPGRTIVVTTEVMAESKRQAVAAKGSEVLVMPSHGDEVDLLCLLGVLGEREITSLLVEGGSRLLGAFFDQQLIDKALVFIAPKIVGGREALGPVGGQGQEKMVCAVNLERVSVDRLGADLLVEGYPVW